MSVMTNGGVRRVLIGVATALLIGLITQVFINTSRISVLEVKSDAFDKSLSRMTTDIETNRIENRSDHQAILDKLDRIQSELVKK